MKNSPQKKAGKDFEDKFLLHQYCKIEEEANPTKKKKQKKQKDLNKKRFKNPETHTVK